MFRARPFAGARRIQSGRGKAGSLAPGERSWKGIRKWRSRSRGANNSLRSSGYHRGLTTPRSPLVPREAISVPKSSQANFPVITWRRKENKPDTQVRLTEFVIRFAVMCHVRSRKAWSDAPPGEVWGNRRPAPRGGSLSKHRNRLNVDFLGVHQLRRSQNRPGQTA